MPYKSQKTQKKLGVALLRLGAGAAVMRFTESDSTHHLELRILALEVGGITGLRYGPYG